MRKRWLAASVVAVVLTATAVPAGVAGAGEASGGAEDAAPSRAEYVVQLERICKPRALATKRAVRGMRSDLRAERLAVAARKFDRAADLFADTVREIKPVPRPPEDRETLSRWFGYLAQEETNLRRIVAVLRADRPVAFQHASARFVKSGNRANNVVFAFDFNYCFFKLSRFE